MIDERLRRWRLALGDPPGTGLPKLSGTDARIAQALDQLYGEGDPKSRKGGLGSSAPRVARWLGELRDLFPTQVVQVIQRDALDRHGMKMLLLEPELLSTVEPDVNLVADLIALGQAIPERSKDLARQVVRKVVDALMEKLAARTQEAVRGALRRSARTRRPRAADIDWDRTVRANLHHWQPRERTIVPERLVGHARGQRRVDEVVLLVDQSGSMAPSVVYASIFAAVLASLPSLRTQLVCFDTAIVDLSDMLADPVDVLFGVQLGGGTDICAALGYVADRIPEPARTHLVLVSDLFEGGDAEGMLARARALVTSGVNVIVLLALSDEGRPGYDPRHAAAFAAMGCPVFACTPDHFPDLMATALGRGDVMAWAAANDIALVRGDAGPAEV